MAISGGGTNEEPAVALVSPAGSSAPPQPATEPDTSTANTKPHSLENGMHYYNYITFSLMLTYCFLTHYFCCITVTIYVNHNCTCGPYFDPRKVKAMPAQFGTGPILNVTRDIFQAFLMAAMSPRQMLSLLKRGEGESISLILESKPTSVRLPIFMEEEDFYIYIRRQLEDLCACEHLLFRRKEACNKCPNTQQPQSTNSEETVNITTATTNSTSTTEKRRWSSQSQQSLSSTIQQQQIQQNSVPSMNNSTLSSPTAAKQLRKSVPGNN